MQDTLIADGLDLLITGMGTVVVFLAALVVLTTAMSGFMGRFFPEPVAPPAKPKPTRKSQPVDEKTLQVIQKAISEHRKR